MIAVNPSGWYVWNGEKPLWWRADVKSLRHFFPWVIGLAPSSQFSPRLSYSLLPRYGAVEFAHYRDTYTGCEQKHAAEVCLVNAEGETVYHSFCKTGASFSFGRACVGHNIDENHPKRTNAKSRPWITLRYTASLSRIANFVMIVSWAVSKNFLETEQDWGKWNFGGLLQKKLLRPPSTMTLSHVYCNLCQCLNMGPHWPLPFTRRCNWQCKLEVVWRCACPFFKGCKEIARCHKSCQSPHWRYVPCAWDETLPNVIPLRYDDVIPGGNHHCWIFCLWGVEVISALQWHKRTN